MNDLVRLSSVGKLSTGIFRLHAGQILPDLVTLWQTQGKRRYQPSTKLTGIAELALAEAVTLIKPTAVWALKEFASGERTFPNADWRQTLSPAIPAELRDKVKGVIGVVCTIGGALETCVRRRFADGNNISAYLLDQIGTLAVANLAQSLTDHLSTGYEVIRWAPGDAGLTLSQQRSLFDLVPAQRIGVYLSKKDIMTPVKSLSFGLFTGQNLAKRRCVIFCHDCAWQGACKVQNGNHDWI